MRDENFINKLSSVEKRARKSFVAPCDNFLDNYRSDNYVAIINEFLSAYGEMDCNMPIKMHLLHSHQDFFPENLGQFSDEQGEHFHQEMVTMEKRFEGKDTIKMIPQYCWSLKRDTDNVELKKIGQTNISEWYGQKLYFCKNFVLINSSIT